MMRSVGRVILLIVWLVGAIGAATTGAQVYIRLVYLSVLVLAVAWAWTLISLKGIRIKRRTRSLRASMGDIFTENFELINDSLIPHLWLEVANESTLPAAAGSRVITLIGSHENRIYIARTRLLQRGAFPLGPTLIVSGDPFGLFFNQIAFPATESLLVLPFIIPISEFHAHAGYLPGGKVIQRKSFDVTPHAAGVREYATGDSVKRIHWPSTARRNRLMVKEFEQDPQAQIWIFLDAQAWPQAALPYEMPVLFEHSWSFAKRPEITLQPSTLEYGVSIAASLAHYFIAQKRAVGFVSAGPVYTVIPAERSQRQESKMLETLAFIRGEGSLSLAGVVSAHAGQMPLGSSVILITPTVSGDLLLAVDDLTRRNLHPQVILLMAESFGGRPGSEEIADKLDQRGVPVCRIACGDDLPAALSAFAQKSQYKEFRAWQALPSIPLT
jgi:uncharacterized protein (DUF58 family)